MLLTEPGSNKKAEVCTDLELNEVINFFSGSFAGDEERIDKALLQFIGENFKDFKTIISGLAVQMPNAFWLNIAKSFPRHSNAHEIALRKIEERVYCDVNRDENAPYLINRKDQFFLNIDRFTLGLDEADLVFLYGQLMLPQRDPGCLYATEVRYYHRCVEVPISWGRSHTNYWRAFPTSLALYVVACVLCEINKDKYEKLLEDSENFYRNAFYSYQFEILPRHGP